MKVFMDTGAFCALAIPKDRHNLQAKSHYSSLQKRKADFYTSNYVLDETYTLLKSRNSHGIAVKFMDEIASSHVIIIIVTKKTEEDAQDIFRRIEYKKLSYTDCTSFALINQFNINAVFAFDEHFRYHAYSHPVEFCG